jgi:hypothetical protein
MTLFNFLLANQSLSFQIGSPNKKARLIVQRAFRVIKTIPKNMPFIEGNESISRFAEIPMFAHLKLWVGVQKL